MNVTLIQATPNAIETIAQIASICYDSDPKNPMGLVVITAYSSISISPLRWKVSPALALISLFVTAIVASLSAVSGIVRRTASAMLLPKRSMPEDLQTT